MVGLVHLRAESRANLVEQRNGGEVAVGAASVTVVAHAVGDREILLHFPVVARIELDTGVKLAAALLSELRDFREAAFAVAQDDAGYWIVQGVASAARERTPSGCGFDCGAECTPYRRL